MENAAGRLRADKRSDCKANDHEQTTSRGLRQRISVLTEELEARESELKSQRHRVRNNLQLILSITNLQAASCLEPVSLQLFSELRDRVHAIALLQEKILGAPNVESLDLAICVRDLLQYLKSANARDFSGVCLTMDLDSVMADLNVAVPFALLTNELASMAFRHFADNPTEKQLFLSLKPDAGNLATLTVRSNVAPPCVEDGTKGDCCLARRFVDLIVRQIGATFCTPRTEKGVEFQVVFPTSIGLQQPPPAPANVGGPAASRHDDA